jgi:plastocyanin
MIRKIGRSSIALALIGAFSAHAVFAGTLSVSVSDKTGAAAADTVIVFDPLGESPPPAHATAIIDQVDKKFSPRVSVIRTGTSISFPNSDRIRHQVYSFSTPHAFTLKLYAGSPRVDELFDKPGLVVLGCNIHDTMVAFVGVVDSPYFAVTPPSGHVELSVPPGRYRLRVWHPGLVAPFESQQITVGNGPLALPLAINLDPSRETAAAWPE